MSQNAALAFGPFRRLTRPGDPCGNCDTTMGDSLVCPGCGWVDPPAGHREEGR